MSYNTDLQSNNTELQEILDAVNALPEENKNAVLYTEQTLTEEQRAQARENIGAASENDVSEAADAIGRLENDFSDIKSLMAGNSYTGTPVTITGGQSGVKANVTSNVEAASETITLKRCGKNLAPLTDFTIYAAQLPGAFGSGEYNMPPGTYKFSADSVVSSLSSDEIPVFFVQDSSGVSAAKSLDPTNQNLSTYTTDLWWRFSSFYATASGSTNTGQTATYTNFQCEVGDTATEFEEYVCDTYSADLPVSAAGEFNWTTGKFKTDDGEIYELGAQQISLLDGVNNLYSTAGDTTVEWVSLDYVSTNSVEQTVIAGSTNPVSGGAVETRVAETDACAAALNTRLTKIDRYYREVGDYAQIPQQYQDNKTLTLCLMSDSHYTNGNTTRINETSEIRMLEDYMHCDAYLHLGDILTTGYTTRETPLRNLASFVKYWRSGHTKPVLMLRGNHDDNCYGVNDGRQSVNTDPDALINRKMWHNMVTQMAHPHAVFPENDPTANYFYMDVERAKVRIIFLDTDDYPEIVEADGTMRYTAYTASALSNAQLNFVGEALNFSGKDNPSDWGVVITSHIPLDLSKEAGERMGITDMKICGLTAFFGILNAYRDGTSYRGSGDDWNLSHAPNKQAGDFAYSVDVDYTGQGEGEVICLVAGHTHTDNTSDIVGGVGSASYGYRYITTAASGYANMIVDRKNRIIYMTKRAKRNGYVLVDVNNPGVIAGLTIGAGNEWADVDENGVYKVQY